MSFSWEKTALVLVGGVSIGAIGYFGYKIYKTYKRLYMEGQIEEILAEDDETEQLKEDVKERLEVIKEREEYSQFVPLRDHADFNIMDLPHEPYDELVWCTDAERTSNPGGFRRATMYNDKVVSDYITWCNEEEDRIAMEALTKKEVTTEMMIHDKDSNEALMQFRRMMLADFDSSTEEYTLLNFMFDEMVLMEERESSSTYGNIEDKRIDFFGPDSKWIGGWTWAETLIYYGSRASFDVPEYSYYEYVEDWIRDFGLDPNPDEVETLCEDLNSNTYWYNGVYGVFSLYEEDVRNFMGNYRIKEREDLTLEQQYQIWLQRKLGIQ